MDVCTFRWMCECVRVAPAVRVCVSQPISDRWMRQRQRLQEEALRRSTAMQRIFAIAFSERARQRGNM